MKGSRAWSGVFLRLGMMIEGGSSVRVLKMCYFMKGEIWGGVGRVG